MRVNSKCATSGRSDADKASALDQPLGLFRTVV
jgi:hypothetical protein